jgi:hypothetical protein
MSYIFSLQVCSTGETVFTEETERNMVGWQKITERKILRNGNRAERYKEAILANDTIVAWENFDKMQQEAIDISPIIEYAFRGYDKYFEERINGRRN